MTLCATADSTARINIDKYSRSVHTVAGCVTDCCRHPVHVVNVLQSLFLRHDAATADIAVSTGVSTKTEGAFVSAILSRHYSLFCLLRPVVLEVIT